MTQKSSHWLAMLAGVVLGVLFGCWLIRWLAAHCPRCADRFSAPDSTKVGTDGAARPQALGEIELPLHSAPADDLTRISGIGQKYAADLAAAGITSFARLAALSETAVETIIAAPAWRKADYAEWLSQAGALARGE